MSTYSKEFLTGGAGDGTPIVVAATDIASSPTTIHTVPASVVDEVTLYAHNSASAAVDLQIGWGETADPIIQSIPAKSGLTLLVPGDLCLDAGLVVVAAADTADVITIFGAVRRLT